MTAPYPYRLTGPIGRRATLGLIVLQVDETIEQDFRRLCAGPDVALYVTRIPSGADLTPDTIAEMEHVLPQAAGLLPPGADFDSVGYACTSATAQLGPDRVARLVKDATGARAVADPLSAALGALAAVGANRVGLVSPYTDAVAAPIRGAFRAAGLAVPATLSFGEAAEVRVARIAPASILAAVEHVAQDATLDAVFVSCTNLRATEIVTEAEHRIGRPVITSNLALSWQMFGHAGLDPGAAPGRLFARPGPTD
jgi:maleate isomerase